MEHRFPATGRCPARRPWRTRCGSVSNGNIVLLTDNASTSAQTVEALPLIIDQLQAAGYELLSLSDLIKTDEDLAEELKSLTK